MRVAVVDASAVVEVLRRTPKGERAATVLRGVTLTAPAHLDAEVMSALARLARENPADAPHVTARLRTLSRAPITRFQCPALLGPAWELRDNISIRDAMYAALARRLNAPLVTADARLARASTASAGLAVEVV